MLRTRGIPLITICLLAGLAAGPASAGAAIFVVTDTGDPAPGACVSGVDCSLREAVNAANASSADDTVQLAGDATLSITGAAEDSNATGDLDATAAGGDLTIQGTGGTRALITQTATDRVLHVPAAGPDLTLVNVTVTGGAPESGHGAGVHFLGSSTTLTLDNAAISGNVAPDSQGGGLRIVGPSTALSVINGSDVTGNSGASQGGGIVFGGNGGTLSVTNSEITGNSASDEGGGIWVDTNQSFQMQLTGAAITGNHVGGGGDNGNGGGIYVITEGTGTNTATITGGTISNNSAGGGGGGGGAGGDGSGGGIYLAEFDISGTVTSSMTVDGTTLDENTAGGEGGDGRGSGGAISSGVWDVTLTGATVSDNRAGVSDDAEDPLGVGGGIVASGEVGQDLEIQGSLLTRNQASEASGDAGEGGGAVYKLGPGDLTIADSAITDNLVGGPDDADGGIQGGGVFRFEETGDPSDSIVRSTFSGNEAVSGNGATGGGLSISTPGSIAIDRSSFTDNTATGGTSASGGGIRFEVFGDDGAATLVNSTVHGNRALAPGVAAFGGFGGGVIANINAASTPLLISHSTITSNEAEAGDPDSEAGNLYTDGDPVELRATIIAGGIAGDSGHENCLNIPAITQQVSLGENLEDTSPTQCELVAAGDQVGIDPLLGPPALNGLPAGSSLTRALLPGSPALDSVPTGGLCPAVDQRGVARPQGGACDAGAFELGVDPPAPLVLPPQAKPKKCKKGFVKKKVKGKSKCVKKKKKKSKKK